jgi:hypothetical protein
MATTRLQTIPVKSARLNTA